jgi:hypothetical protein
LCLSAHTARHPFNYTSLSNCAAKMEGAYQRVPNLFSDNTLLKSSVLLFSIANRIRPARAHGVAEKVALNKTDRDLSRRGKTLSKNLYLIRDRKKTAKHNLFTQEAVTQLQTFFQPRFFILYIFLQPLTSCVSFYDCRNRPRATHNIIYITRTCGVMNFYAFLTRPLYGEMKLLTIISSLSIVFTICFRRCWPDPSDTVGRREAFRTVVPINGAGAHTELPLARVPPLDLELGHGRRVEDCTAHIPNPCWQVSSHFIVNLL